jgi:large subunit ribosomal protein L4
MQLAAVKADGNEAAGLEVSERAFGAEFNEALIHQVVVGYQAGGRAGTRAQKNRSAVRGGGAKPWRQKGTGRARAGTNRSPLWRGGGKTFPASTHDFSQKVNRKMYRAALRSILSELARQGRLLVCDDLAPAEAKTRDLAARLKTIGAENALIVCGDEDRNLALAARNLPHVDVCETRNMDPVRLIAYQQVIMNSAAVRQIEEWLQ